MRNRGKSWLAILMILAMAFVLVGCTGSGGKDETSAQPTTEATEASTEDVFAETDLTEESTSEPEDTTEGTTESTTADTAASTTADQTSASSAATTTKPAATTTANTKPSTTAEIVAYFNTAVNKVKTAKPGYSMTARTIIDDKKVSSPSGFIDRVAPSIIKMAKNSWEKWSDPVTVAKGANHNEFPVAGQSWSSKLQADWVKSATCTENGGNYIIKIVLKDETVSDLPTDMTTTKHGQVIKAFTKAEIADGASKLGVNIQRFSCAYSGCYAEITVDKATGNVKKAFYYNNAQVDMQAKIGLTLEASLPLAQENVYTF